MVEMELKTGTSIYGDRYSIKSCIGNGGFGITYVAWDNKLKREVVLKEYFPQYMVRRDSELTNEVVTISQSYNEEFHTGIDKFLKEAQVLATLKGIPEIAEIHDYFQDNNTAYIVMEYIQGSNLKRLIRSRAYPYTFDEAMKIIGPCLNILRRVHAAGIIHRDFTPDNIIIEDSGKIRIIDFGSSRDYVNNQATMTVMVKHGYAPVEQYSNTVKQAAYTDVYSVCAILYEMVTLHKPVSALDRVASDALVQPREYNSMLTVYQNDAIMKGLALNCQQRYQTAAETMAALSGSIEEARANHADMVSFENDSKYMPKSMMEKDSESTMVLGFADAPAAESNDEMTEIVSMSDVETSEKKKANWEFTLLCVILVASICAFGFLIINNLSGSKKTYEKSKNTTEEKVDAPDENEVEAPVTEEITAEELEKQQEAEEAAQNALEEAEEALAIQEALAKQQAEESGYIGYVVVNERIKVRSSASTEADTMGTVNQGQKLNVLRILGDWYEIEYEGSVGYVVGRFVTFYDGNDAAEEGTPQSTNDENSVKYIVVTTNNVNVRASASRDADVLGTANAGEKYEVFSTGAGWYGITFKNRTGYVPADYAVFREGNMDADKGYVGYVTCDEPITVTAGTERTSEIIGQMEPDAHYYVKALDPWPYYTIVYEGRTGYVKAADVTYYKE